MDTIVTALAEEVIPLTVTIWVALAADMTVTIWVVLAVDMTVIV